MLGFIVRAVHSAHAWLDIKGIIDLIVKRLVLVQYNVCSAGMGKRPGIRSDSESPAASCLARDGRAAPGPRSRVAAACLLGLNLNVLTITRTHHHEPRNSLKKKPWMRVRR
jgi:hypothetical protein